jgi:pyruvate kinase
MTQIITTIGPASLDSEVLSYFVEHNVRIARLNFSHGTSDWHLSTGQSCRKHGLELMLDLAGPKILLGHLNTEIEIKTGETIAIEFTEPNQEYPANEIYQGKPIMLLPCQFEIQKFAVVGKDILVDDGKMVWTVQEVLNDKIICKAAFGGLVKSNKGMNLPEMSINLDFLVKRDVEMLRSTLAKLKPEYVAPSFVKSMDDLNTLKVFINQILEENGITDYYPKICTKLETSEVLEEANLQPVIDASDMVMIARGDLALEVLPPHILTPFQQTQIGNLCKQKGTPFIVATEMLSNMTENPVPTRAEVSDIYRAVVIEKANFIMLSGESAAGKFPKQAIEIMDAIIKRSQETDY